MDTREQADTLLERGSGAAAAALYGQLRQDSPDDPALLHNLALAQIDAGDVTGMHTLQQNMATNPTYTASFVLAAAMHKFAARQGDAEALTTALSLLENRGPPTVQACILLSELYALQAGGEATCIEHHITALRMIGESGSMACPNFNKAFMDRGGLWHYFDMPPEAVVVTGSLPERALLEGRCLVLQGGSSQVPVESEFAAWPVAQLTHSVGPAKTPPGTLHARTPHRWAARFAAVTAILKANVGEVLFWDTDALASFPSMWPAPDGHTCVTSDLEDSLATFSLQAPHQETRNGLLALFASINVPTARPHLRMADQTFWWMASKASLEVVRATRPSPEERQHDETQEYAA